MSIMTRLMMASGLALFLLRATDGGFANNLMALHTYICVISLGFMTVHVFSQLKQRRRAADERAVHTEGAAPSWAVENSWTTVVPMLAYVTTPTTGRQTMAQTRCGGAVPDRGVEDRNTTPPQVGAQ